MWIIPIVLTNHRIHFINVELELIIFEIYLRVYHSFVISRINSNSIRCIFEELSSSSCITRSIESIYK
nr:MAG TPA: hypothetical protein [Crassvirales sp.]